MRCQRLTRSSWRSGPLSPPVVEYSTNWNDSYSICLNHFWSMYLHTSTARMWTSLSECLCTRNFFHASTFVTLMMLVWLLKINKKLRTRWSTWTANIQQSSSKWSSIGRRFSAPPGHGCSNRRDQEISEEALHQKSKQGNCFKLLFAPTRFSEKSPHQDRNPVGRHEINR